MIGYNRFGEAVAARCGVVEEITQSIYDHVKIDPKNTDHVHFFQKPIGFDGKTVLDTSMYLAHQLPPSQGFEIKGVGLSGGMSEEVADCLNRSTFELIIGSKLYLRIAPATGLFVASLAAYRCCFPIKPALGIMGEQDFSAELISNPGRSKSSREKGELVRIGCYLTGTLYRPVQ